MYPEETDFFGLERHLREKETLMIFFGPGTRAWPNLSYLPEIGVSIWLSGVWLLEGSTNENNVVIIKIKADKRLEDSKPRRLSHSFNSCDKNANLFDELVVFSGLFFLQICFIWLLNHENVTNHILIISLIIANARIASLKWEK